MISKMFTFLATLAVENREYLGSFQNKISKIFFQMSAQVYSVPAQTEGRRKAFLEWKSIDSSYELSVTCGDNVNNYKSVHHPIPTSKNWEHLGNFQNKSLSSALNLVSTCILFMTKLKGARRETTL